MEAEPILADDLLQGAEEIAAFTGLKRRTIYHAAERGALPIRRVEGVGLVALKSSLRAFFAVPMAPAENEEPRPRVRNPRSQR